MNDHEGAAIDSGAANANLAERVSADVAVIGDGPAGSALASALNRLGVDVVLIGPDEPWSATYTTWADDVEGLELLNGMDPWAHRFDGIAAHFGGPRHIERAYGVFDNEALRAHLRDGVRHVSRIVHDLDDIDALVVDATGWPSKLPGAVDRRRQVTSWQTAFGAVFAEPPTGPLSEPTMMDFSEPGRPIADREFVPTFAYSLPVPDGWLVEETVLSATPAVDPDALLAVLAARLDMTTSELLNASLRTEIVRIPMGVSPPSIDDRGPIRFGAAAGMIHPATGYSVGSALRSAGAVAQEIRKELERSAALGAAGAFDTESITSAVWSPAARRTRQLHDYGHDVLLKLDRAGVQRFFDTFFDLPVETWSPYMRIDTPPTRLAAVMAKMFTKAPMRLRGRLLTGNPRRFLRLLRP